MKKTIKIIILSIMMIMSIMTLSSQAFSIDVTTDKTVVEKDDEIILKIKTSEKTIATNFNINYDSKRFELIGNVTEGLKVAKKDNIIACIYADMSLKGTDTFEIKFKVLDSSKKATFSIENAKFATNLDDTTYSNEEITGIEKKVEVKGKNSNKLMIIIGAIAIFVFIAFVIIKGKGEKNEKNN